MSIDTNSATPSTAHTEIVCILDRSGSMSTLRDDAIGGFNTFLDAQQKLPGEASLTLVLFDHDYVSVLDAVPVAKAEPLTTATYVPRGSTALLDAVGRTLDDTEARMSALTEAERPARVLVCILTDGLENASREYTRDGIRTMIEARQKQGWAFEFLAANQDAFAEAGSLGIGGDYAFRFVNDGAGIRQAFVRMESRAALFRGRRSDG